MYDWESPDEMLKFDANHARKIAIKSKKNDLYDILSDIKQESENGGTILYIEHSVKESVLCDLKHRGFDVRWCDDELFKIMW